MHSTDTNYLKSFFLWMTLLASFAGFLAQGCTSTSLMQAQQDVRQSFYSGDLDRSYRILQSGNFYRSNDQVLRKLELGTVHYFSGNYRESMETFQDAETEIDRLFGMSVERNLRALLVNDGQLEYQGEDYEDIMINMFNALSAVHLKDFDAALVETRRISHKLETLAIRYDGIVSALSRQDTTDVKEAGDWERGSTNIESLAFGHYLSYVIYANQGRRDDARIQYQRFRREHARMYPSQRWTTPRQQTGRMQSGGQVAPYPQPGNVMLLGFGGQGPHKVSNELRIYSDDLSTYIKFAVPSIRRTESRIHSVQAVVNDTLTVDMPMLDDFSMIAEDVFSVRRPLIVVRAIARSTLKYLASQGTQRAVRNEFGEGAGWIAGLVTGLATEISEVADLRAWQSMPGKVYAQTVSLPEGTHSVRYRYFGARGVLLHEQQQTIEVTGGHPLYLSEAIYWN